MKITFQYIRPPIEEILQFEDVYEEGLKMDKEEKEAELAHGYYLWMRVDGQLAGEIYAFPTGDDEEDVPDLLSVKDGLYISSFTILPAFQGKKLGSILFAHFLAIQRFAFPLICWHATSAGMDKLSNLFDAELGTIHSNWYGSGRLAVFRILRT